MTSTSVAMVARGDRAPDFALPDEAGVLVRLGDLLTDGPVVLFFYPAAMTLGCTAEACHFRDAGADFEAVGARRIGISADPAWMQQEFSAKNRLDFPLLSDGDGSVARSYGARQRIRDGAAKRATFVVGADGVVLGVVTNQVWMKAHADRALEMLRGGCGI